MKSRDGKSQREGKSRREKIREEKESEERSCRWDARKGRKVAKHFVFPMICGSGGSKSRLAKAAGAEPSGQMRDEKLHAVVVRSTFWSQNVQNTPGPDHFWKLRCRKSARRCGAKHMLKSKCTKHTRFGRLLEVVMSKKCRLLWRETHFEVKMCKAHHVRTTFGRSELVSRGRRKGLCTLSKVKREGFVASISKNDGRRGTFEEDLQRCISRGSGSTKDMFIRDVRRSGRWFPERGCILEHQIFRFAEMILRDRCSTSYDLASMFRGRRSTLDRWSGKNRTTHWYEAASSALNFRKSRRIAWFIDVVKIKNWRSLAELLRFGCCQVQKLKKSRRIASFWMLSSSKNEEVSQNCFVFDVVNFEKCEEVTQNYFVFDVLNFEKWGSHAELLRFWCCQVQNLRTSRRIGRFSSLQIDW